MDWKGHIRKRIAELRLNPAREAEIVEELAQHLADVYAERRAAGASEESARRAALDELATGALARELLRAERPAAEPMPEPVAGKRGNPMAGTWNDVRFALRSLAKSPGFTAVAILTLALGIGGNTAIFSVVNAALLRPLPYEDPDRLVHLFTTHQRQGFSRSELAYPNYLDYRARNQVFTDMGGYNGTSFTLTGRGLPERVTAERVSASFFSTLGLRPHRGRFFTAEEEAEGTQKVVVLSHGAWQRRFGGDPAILGQTLVLTGRPYTVIGVLPPEFHFAPARMAELWVPLYATEDQRTRRSFYWFNGIARLKPGVTLEQAQTEMDGQARQLAEEHPQTNSNQGVAVVALRERFLGTTRDAVLVLLGAVGFLLLIACVNLANLLLARAASRGKEMAVRAALGASPMRLVRQVLVESLLLALAGGAAGAIVAYWGVAGLLAAIPERFLARAPYLMNTQIDGAVLFFTLAISLATGGLFGLFPALRASRVSLQDCLKDGGRTTAGAGRNALRGALVTTEVALALVLAVGTGLFLQSVWRLAGADPGFQKENALIFRVSVPLARYPEPPRVIAFYRELRERLGGLPGVVDVSVTSGAPLTGAGGTVYLKVDGAPDPEPGKETETVIRDVSPNHFSVLGVPLRAGRYFTESDGASAPRVAILSETLAKQMFPNEDPIGRSVYIFVARSAWQVVGVVPDVSLGSVDESVRPVLYTCNLQDPSWSTDVVLRAAGDPTALLPAIRGTVSAMDPEIAVYGVATMEEAQLSAPSVFQRRALAGLLGIFAGLALALAAVGIYGVMSYAVTQRRHEIGIRMALGAQRGNIFGLLLREGMLLAGAGVVIGLAGAFALTRLLQSLLFGVKPTDPLTFTAMAALLVGVALMACYLPARRATRVDPIVALRYE